ncbi:MAG: TIGR02186 family protein, partial [Deltaproteobacteria bacterium]|nr:TIGR02186 family protein [Deltaproteobacteria bacterium]
LLLSIGVIFAGVSLPAPAQASSLKVNPPHLEIGTFFSGHQISLTGSIPTNRNVVIEIKGPEEKSVFNMKGRVGPFWMNRGKLELEKAPFLYLLLLPEGKEWSAPFSSFGVGIEQLKQTIIIRPHDISLDVVFPRFVKLKRSEHLYGELKGAIRYSPSTERTKLFEGKFSFPSSTLPGEYQIVTKVLNDGKIEETSVHGFTVKEVGFIKTVHELAYHRGLLYGISCVLIALFVGAVIGLFFKGGGAH